MHGWVILTQIKKLWDAKDGGFYKWAIQDALPKANGTILKAFNSCNTANC